MGRAISGPDREHRERRVDAEKENGRGRGRRRMMIRKGKKDKNFITEFLKVSMVLCVVHYNVLNFFMRYPSHSIGQYCCTESTTSS